MLSNTLVTNEVKNSAGTEVEFQRISTNNRDTEFAMISEPPDAPHRISVRHTEVGVGIDRRRRSNIQVSKVAAGASTLPRKHIASFTIDTPVGDIADYTETKNVLAEMISFVASLGASTTILYDCTGNGAAALINGTL
jgi:hypothetical protein